MSSNLCLAPCKKDPLLSCYIPYRFEVLFQEKECKVDKYLCTLFEVRSWNLDINAIRSYSEYSKLVLGYGFEVAFNIRFVFRMSSRRSNSILSMMLQVSKSTSNTRNLIRCSNNLNALEIRAGCSRQQFQLDLRTQHKLQKCLLASKCTSKIRRALQKK